MTDVAVVGPGAIGATFAAAAERAGHAVTLCGRRDRAGAGRGAAGRRASTRSPAACGRTRTRSSTRPGSCSPSRRTRPPAPSAGSSACAARAPSSPCCRTASSTRRWSRRSPARRPCCPRSCGAPRRRSRPGASSSASARSSACPTPRRARRWPRCSATTRRSTSSPTSVTEAWRKLCFNATAAPMVLTGRRAEVFREAGPLALARRLAEECVAVGRAEGARRRPRDGRGDRRADRRAPARPGHVDALRPARGPAAGVGRAQRRDRRLGAHHGIPTPVSDRVTAELAALDGDD